MTAEEHLAKDSRIFSAIIGTSIGLISTAWFSIPVSIGIGLIMFLVTLTGCAIVDDVSSKEKQ